MAQINELFATFPKINHISIRFTFGLERLLSICRITLKLPQPDAIKRSVWLNVIGYLHYRFLLNFSFMAHTIMVFFLFKPRHDLACFSAVYDIDPIESDIVISLNNRKSVFSHAELDLDIAAP